MKKILRALILLPTFMVAEADKNFMHVSPQFRADASNIPGTPSITTTQANMTAANLQGVINSLIASLPSSTIPNTTIPTSSSGSNTTTGNPTASSSGATPPPTTSSSQVPQNITITTTITTSPTTTTTSTSTTTNSSSTANTKPIAHLMPQKPSPVWTKPLIIDANNPDFDNVSFIKFTENIVYKPSPQYVYPTTYTYYPAAIIVAKDNVTIDLNGFNLSLDPSSAANFLTYNPTYGIAVYQGVKNLKIVSSTPQSIKGSITGFSGYAIYMYGLNQSYNSYDIYSNYIKNAIIDNILISQNVNGIYLLNGVEVSILNCNIVYNYSPRALFGITYANVLNGKITSCKINQNFSFGDVCGISLTDTIDITVDSCETNANRSIKNGNATGVVLSATSSTTSSGNQITNCFATRNQCSYVTGKKSVGFSINNLSFHNIIQNCRATLASHTPAYPGFPTPTIPPQGIGFQINGANSNEIFNNQAVYNDSFGFLDTLLPTSTSFWAKNTAGFNGPTGSANYNVNVPSSTGPKPLPTTKLYLDNLDAFTGAGPQLVNIEILRVAP